MSMRDLFYVALALVVGGCASAAVTPSATESPNLGREATPAQIAGWDISVGPDGVGLPPGKGTSATGAIVYEQKCQVCHAAKGAGQPNDRLVGGQGTLASKAPVRTVGSYWSSRTANNCRPCAPAPCSRASPGRRQAGRSAAPRPSRRGRPGTSARTRSPPSPAC